MDNAQIVKQFLDNQNSPETKRVYGIHVDAFLSFLGHKSVADIELKDVIEYKKYIADNKTITQRHKLIRVKTFLGFCRKIGAIKTNVAELVTAPKAHWNEPAVLTQIEAKMLFRIVEIDPNRTPAVKGRDNCILSLMLGCGLRISEIASLNMESLGEQQGVPVVNVVGKGSKPRSIRLPDSLYQVIKNYTDQFRKGATATDPLFTAFNSNKWGTKVTATNRRMNLRTIENAIMYYIDRSGLREKKKMRVSCHTLRHTAFTLELMHGANIKEIQEQAGHASINTTSQYLHIIDKMEQSGTRFNPLFPPEGKRITTNGVARTIDPKPEMSKTPFTLGQPTEPTGEIPSETGASEDKK